MRGQYGTSWCGFGRRCGRASVGLELFHTVGDRDRAVEQINTDLNMLVAEVYRAMGVDSSVFDLAALSKDPVGYSRRAAAARAAMTKSPVYPLWRDVVSPVLSEWNHFYHDQSSWREWLTSWDEYEHWKDRLKRLRETVSKQVQLMSPEPVDLARTIWGQAGEAASEAALKVEAGVGDAWKIVKYGVIGALVIGGVVALTYAARGPKAAT